MNTKLSRFVAKFAVFITVWTAFFPSTAVNAAEIVYIRDQLARLQVSVNSDHTITFQLPSAGVWGINSSMTLVFATTTAGQANFTWVAGASSTRDIDVSTGTAGTAGPFICADLLGGGTAKYGSEAVTGRTVITTTSTVQQTDSWGFTTTTINGKPSIAIVSPVNTNATTRVPIDAGSCIRIRIGSNSSGTSPGSMLTNPASATATSTQVTIQITKATGFGSTAGDSGMGAIGITADDQTTVNATSTPSLTFEVGSMASATTCDDSSPATDFGTGALAFYDLRADFIQPTSNKLCTRVTSNAANGVAVQIKSLYGRMTSTRNGVTFPASAQTAASSTINITNAAGLNLSNEAYGACVRTKGQGSAGPTPSAPIITSGFNDVGSTTPEVLRCATAQDQALGSGNNTMRLLATSFDTVWSTTGATYRAYTDLYLKAAVSVTTPATNSYTDTLTVIAFATF